MTFAALVTVISYLAALGGYAYVWRWLGRVKEQGRTLNRRERKQSENLILGAWLLPISIATFVGGLGVSAILGWAGVPAILVGSAALARHRDPALRRPARLDQ